VKKFVGSPFRHYSLNLLIFDRLSSTSWNRENLRIIIRPDETILKHRSKTILGVTANNDDESGKAIR